jgi:hypothetical protein
MLAEIQHQSGRLEELEEHEAVVEAARVAGDGLLESGAGVDRVGHVADQGLEDAELGGEQDQEADEQGDVEQPAPVLLAEGVGHEGEVGQLQATGDLARDLGDAHHHRQQQDGQQRHRG